MKGLLVLGFIACILAIMAVYVMAPVYDEPAITQVIANRMRIIYMLIIAGCGAVLIAAAAIVEAIERQLFVSQQILDQNRELLDYLKPKTPAAKPLFDRPPL